MKKYNKNEIELINIQIGCVLRYSRLKKGLSQHELALQLDMNPTTIGRIERFENVSSWDKIFILSQKLNINFCNLFNLMDKVDLLTIIENSLRLEEKLTQDKKDYYSFLRKTIQNKF